jgi:hypothetical protein
MHRLGNDNLCLGVAEFDRISSLQYREDDQQSGTLHRFFSFQHLPEASLPDLSQTFHPPIIISNARLLYLIKITNVKYGIILRLKTSYLEGETVSLDSSIISWLSTSLRVEDRSIEHKRVFILVLWGIPHIKHLCRRLILKARLEESQVPYMNRQSSLCM